MGVPTVTITNPTQSPAAQGAVNFTANGTTQPNGFQVTSMTYQVNDGPSKSIMPGGSGFSSWSFQLTALDCPQTNVTYTVTVYAWNHDGMNDNYGLFLRTA
jgi:hypothetical protein